MNKRIFALLLVPFSIDVTISDPVINIDQDVQVEIEHTQPENYQPDIQTIRSNLLNNLSLEYPPFVLKNQVVKKNKIQFILSPQTAGKHPITFLNIPFISNEGHKFYLPTDIYHIEVKLLKNLQETITPASPIHSSGLNYIELSQENLFLPPEVERNMKIISRHTFPTKTVLFLFTLIAILWLLRKTVQVEKMKEKKPLLTDVDIQEKINKFFEHEKISNEKLFENLTPLIKQYIDMKYGETIQHMTTEELSYEIEKNPQLSKSTQAILIQFFKFTDQVKFAQKQPSNKESSKMKKELKKIINLTTL